ncbi:tRNA_edit domain-containing protein [Chloropicon roscoffensis]|uniref:tRNA_edit domain-containing protein n=1 Tax=Chloropicon roscoffensis TaxID=1461544 RepID=A0A7S3C9Y7_9CHLO
MASSIAVEATALLATRQVALLAAVRQVEVLESLDALELRLASLGSNEVGELPEEEGESAPTTSSASPPPPPLPSDASPTHRAIHAELASKLDTSFPSSFRVVRVPGEYYDRPLEYRRQVLDAFSTSHLCKTMVMENTKDDRPFPEGLDDGEAWSTKYIMVVVQYVSKLHAEKIRDFVFEKRGGKTQRKKIKFRLAPEEVSDAITGYSHNAVTPVASKTKIPLLVSHRVLELRPDFFWLGAGEVDLKVGFSAAEFAEAYGAHVIDCTYDDK